MAVTSERPRHKSDK